jgi:hypothetical protein
MRLKSAEYVPFLDPGVFVSQLSYLFARSHISISPPIRNKKHLLRRPLRTILRKLPLASYHRRVDASLAQRLTALRSWLSRRLQQSNAYAELRRELDAEIRLRAQAMRETWQEAEELARVEIALRIQAERNARQEAEARLEIERRARCEAERQIELLGIPIRRAHPETIARAQSEMIARVQAEQSAISRLGDIQIESRLGRGWLASRSLKVPPGQPVMPAWRVEN